MAKKNELTLAVDKTVGERIGKLRRTMGLSRQQLASMVGVTHQQCAKWEHGTNSVSVGRMAMIASALNKHVSYFFDGLEAAYEPQTVHQRMTMEVARNFAKIKNPGHQSVINNMIREFAKNS